MDSNRSPIVSVAVPVPLTKAFDFLAPVNGATIVSGARVLVPFGRRKLVGVVLKTKPSSEVAADKLKPILEVLDDQSLFPTPLWQTLLWLSSYYLAPVGEVLNTALPVALRRAVDSAPASERRWQLSDYGRAGDLDDLKRAPLQLALIKRFASATSLAASDFKSESSGWRQAIQSLIDKGWLIELQEAPQLNTHCVAQSKLSLNQEQSNAAERLYDQVSTQAFSCTLLHGVTGSGKTEVYFSAIRRALEQGQQTLLLVPEIGLTPQLVERVQNSLDCGVVTLHSGLNDNERHLAWWHARHGQAGIIIGTRSAIFTPTKNLGLIIVDEEHDDSFKQQDGVRYQARDVAIYRAREEGIPIVLGSATPSLESFHNAEKGRFKRLTLTERAFDAKLPSVELLDLRRQPTNDGLSPAMIEAIKQTLDDQKQVLLFLNRRGYAPVLYCKQCQATCRCQRCDCNLTLHRTSEKMRCHHCGYEGRVQEQCSECGANELAEVGEGTQRVEEALQSLFPDAKISRIDRDSTRKKGQLAAKLAEVNAGAIDIVLGTQLLAKGHDFPALSLVGVLGADQGLHSTDFRAREALFQQLLQVAGRAGRRDQRGRVLIQTHFPNEPFFEYLKAHDYCGFAEQLLSERQNASFPPFGHFALLRAESAHQSKALQFLRRVRTICPATKSVSVMDAIPAPMERRAGRYRAQLLFQSNERKTLNQVLRQSMQSISEDRGLAKLASTVRWSLDVDPSDLY